MRNSFSSISICTVGLLIGGIVRAADSPPPERLVPVDTSRLMGSPDPLPPLEVRRAFPRLRFERPLAARGRRGQRCARL